MTHPDGGVGGVSFVVVVVFNFGQKVSFLFFENLKCFQHLRYIEVGSVLFLFLSPQRLILSRHLLKRDIVPAFTAKNMILQIIFSANYFPDETT